MVVSADTRRSLKAFAAPITSRSSGVGLLAAGLLAVTALVPADARAAERDAVRDWNSHAIIALTNTTAAGVPGTGFSPPVAIIHLAIVQGAVYDAVNAIKGGHDPYLGKVLAAPTSASKGAAAATAAHRVLIALVDQAPAPPATVKADIKARLNANLATSLAQIPDGEAKNQGIRVGEKAAANMLANRVGDGRFGAPGFPGALVPNPAAGDWRPLDPANPATNDRNGWVRMVRPFTLPHPEFFHSSGTNAVTSAAYAVEYNEVKALGRDAGSTRTPEQTSLAYWSAGHPVPMMFAAMREVSVSKNLTISQDARFFAKTSMATADSIINCWAEKAHWNFWRPTTAIRLGDTDGNDDTAGDGGWTALLPVPPYPDETSGANCFVGGLMNSARLFFGSDAAQFDMVSPGLGGTTGSTRHYSQFSAVITDMIDARVYGGLHFRRADVNGAALGARVADYVDKNFFNCSAPGQCKQEERE